MKINSFKVAFMLPFLFAGLVITGCSNEDIVEDKPQEGMRKVSFSISEEDYEPAEEVAGSRAAAPSKPELQDLGDGWMAEVSLESDTTHAKEAKEAEAKTRAIYGSAHYTIQAYQGGVKKGELKGTFQGSTFTPDAGGPESISLPHGTYDFVCFNDKVSANGTQFTFNRADAATARFTVKRGVVINQDPKQYVAFEMKHAGVQLNFYLNYANFGVKMAIKSQDSYIAGSMLYTTYYLHAENPAERVKYTVESLSNSIPETMIYDYSANTFSYPSQGTQSPLLSEIDDYNFVSGGGAPTVTESRFDRGQTFYCLPSTDISKFKVAFTFGEFHGHSLVGKSIMIPTHKLVEANKKYNIIVNLYLSPIYLFNDGTTGSLTENPSKTPVGVVVDPTKKIAVALHDVSKYGSNFMQWSYSDSRESAYPATNYGMLFDPLKAGNSNNSYNSTSPAMSAAENYYNTVGYGNAFGSTNRWYIPTLEDFLLMGVSLGKLPNKTSWEVWSYAGYDFSYLIPSNAPETGFMGASPNFPPMDMTRFNKAFTDAGGTAPSDVYWTRTECQDGGNYKQGIISIGGGYNFDLRSKTSIARVRPFIKY